MSDTAALTNLLGACGALDGEVGGVPAATWWPAFVLVVIDTGCKAEDALDAPRSAFDPAEGTLALGSFVFALHRHAADALGRLLAEHRSGELFPWPAGAKLEDGLQRIFYQARLWNCHGKGGKRRRFPLKGTLEQLAAIPRDALDQIDLSAPFVPRGDQPKADFCPNCQELVADDLEPHRCRAPEFRWWARPGGIPPLACRDPRARQRPADDEPSEPPGRRVYAKRTYRMVMG